MFCPNTSTLKIPWNLYNIIIKTDQRTKQVMFRYRWALCTGSFSTRFNDEYYSSEAEKVVFRYIHVSIKNIFQGEKSCWFLERGYCLFVVVLDMSNNLWVWLLLLMSARDASSVVLLCIPRKTKGFLRASLGLLTVVYGVAWCGTQL